MPALRRADDRAPGQRRVALPPLRPPPAAADELPAMRQARPASARRRHQRAEERLRILFPNHPVLRIDRDSTSRKHAMRDLFATINSGEPCILVGTQMLAKAPLPTGHPGGDPRCRWRPVFRRLPRQRTHGPADRRRPRRTRRGAGRVLIQTHLADHPLLVQLTEDGYFAFAEQALSERRRRPAALRPPRPAARRSAQAGPGGSLDSACSAAEQLLEQMGGPEVELLAGARAHGAACRQHAQLLLQCMSRRRCIAC